MSSIRSVDPEPHLWPPRVLDEKPPASIDPKKRCPLPVNDWPNAERRSARPPAVDDLEDVIDIRITISNRVTTSVGVTVAGEDFENIVEAQA